MASFKQHMEACWKQFGPLTNAQSEICEAVNHRLDQFAHYPDYNFLERHRKFLHHKEGVEYFWMKYGELGRKAAELHIKMDTGGYIPDAIEYYTGTVDKFGVPKKEKK